MGTGAGGFPVGGAGGFPVGTGAGGFPVGGAGGFPVGGAGAGGFPVGTGAGGFPVGGAGGFPVGTGAGGFPVGGTGAGAYGSFIGLVSQSPTGKVLHDFIIPVAKEFTCDQCQRVLNIYDMVAHSGTEGEGEFGLESYDVCRNCGGNVQLPNIIIPTPFNSGNVHFDFMKFQTNNQQLFLDEIVKWAATVYISNNNTWYEFFNRWLTPYFSLSTRNKYIYRQKLISSPTQFPNGLDYEFQDVLPPMDGNDVVNWDRQRMPIGPVAKGFKFNSRKHNKSKRVRPRKHIKSKHIKSKHIKSKRVRPRKHTKSKRVRPRKHTKSKRVKPKSRK